MKELKASADEASNLLKSLANRLRLQILCELAAGERSVGDIARELGIRDTVASQHLGLLRREGIVGNRREAQTIYYRVKSEPARQVLETLYKLYCAPKSRRGR
ncbi:MAG: transcriptional regulator [Betaproteobacteria bacterium RIFCSPLOWO2_12_FULL_65_14]|nr:MAG: transcriptional regulator [Betaproteobacteria bacterium RIFCSPLOWO2_12_FULL_65_14]